MMTFTAQMIGVGLLSVSYKTQQKLHLTLQLTLLFPAAVCMEEERKND